MIDQLEESVLSDDHDNPGSYIQKLWTIAASDDMSIVIGTLRIDAINVAGSLTVGTASGTSQTSSLENLVYGGIHAIFIRQLETEQLVMAIQHPAKQVGLDFDPGLVDRLCSEALVEPGALPMLELALDRLWMQRSSRTLSASGYEGGLARTLSAHANACIVSLTTDEQNQAKRILIGVATGENTEISTWRRRSTIDKLRPVHIERQVAFDSALHALICGRLIVSDIRNGGNSIELAHDLLLRQWSTLIEWIRESQPRLQVIRDLDGWVAEWHLRDTLLTPDQLAHVVRAQLGPDDTSLAMKSLIDASQRHARRQKRLRQSAFAFIVLVAMMLAGLLYWAISERDHARKQTQLAEHRLDQAIGLTKVVIWDILPSWISTRKFVLKNRKFSMRYRMY
ncbi:hypothetical protein ACNOYE_04075 [Nannocystaceae bacterium ST9]